MECNVARDLMPLVQDDVASEESMRAVSEHVAGCSACAEYLKDMQSALETAAVQQETERQDFDKAAHQLRLKRRRRVWRNVLIGVLVGMVLMLGGMQGWMHLTQGYAVTMDYAEYGVSLARLQNGEVAVNIDFRGSSLLSVIDVNETEPDANGRSILYISRRRSDIPQYLETAQPNYCCMSIPPETLGGYAEIRSGTPDVYEVVWKPGDAIPAASDELETYMALTKELGELPRQETDEPGVYVTTPEAQERETEIYNQMADLQYTIPEWQTKWK